jgi:amino acid adenylation domain-containing protein/FkbM family methyltransferase
LLLQLASDAPEPDGIEDSYVASRLQEGMLFHSLYAPGQRMYVRQIILSLREEIDVSLLKRAWERSFGRHAMLRASLRWEGVAEPVIDVHSRLELPFEQQDWRSEVGATERDARLESFLFEERRRGFDLATPPLMRLKLLRLADADYRLVWTFHHVLSDGYSDVLLIREVFAFYDSALRGEEILLDDPVSYRAYCDWLRQQDTTQAEAYWRERLKGFTEPTPLSMGVASAGAEESVEERRERVLKLPAELTAKLKSLAREHDLTLSTMLHGAWALLLSRYSGQDDVVFGGVRGCRRSALDGKGGASIVGPFINTVPLRVHVPPDAELLSWLKTLRQQWLDLRDYEHTPLVKVLDYSEVPRGTPLFESTVAYDKSQMNTALHAQGTPSWRNRELRTLQARSNYPLTLATYGEDEFLITVRYDQQRFEDSGIELMLERLRRLFEHIAANIEQKLSDIELLTADEERKLLYEWNAAATVKHPLQVCLHRLFEQQAARRPKAEAVIVAGGERLTYAELNARANRLARYLRSLGVGAEQRVGICAERGATMLVAVLGVLKACGAYVPLDPTYPSERLSYMAKDAGVRVLLSVGDAGEAAAKECGAHLIRLDEEPDEVAREREDDPGWEVAAEATAYVIYTSGSTGRPKGVMVSHRNVVRLFKATAPWFDFGERDVWTLFHSFAFDFSVWEIWGALLHGGRLVVVPFWVSRTPEAFYDLLAAEQITVLNQTPSAFRQLMAVEDTPGAAKELSLRLIIFGGEALNLQSLQPWFERHGDERPQLVNMYGITETTVHVTYRPLCADDAGVASGSMIGRPIPDLQTYILDSRLRAVPIALPGELYVGGAGVARGYLDRPALTAERFIPDPFSPLPGARLYKTGDVARYLPNADIEFLGRSDEQVKVRGFRIELGEIEAVAVRHPAVREAMVVACEDAQGQARLAAYFVPDPQRAPTIRRLLRFNRDGLHREKALHEFPNGMTAFHLNKSEADFMYQEIFEERSYLRHGVTLGDAACIFDVGANIGIFTLFAGQSCRNAVVYAFEPAPPVFDVLRANAELYGLDVRLFKHGLSDAPKTQTFTYYPHVSVVSGLYADDAQQREIIKAFLLNREQPGDGETSPDGKLLDELLSERLTSEQFTCHFKPLSDVIRENGVERIDLLKIDVERSEWDVLAGIGEEDWEKIRQIVVEVHDIDGRLAEVTSLLKRRGYEVTTQQDTVLKDTGLYNVYAVSCAQDGKGTGTAKDASCGEFAPIWHSPDRLIADVRNFLAAQVPNYMVPADFVLLESIPLTPNGKLDRRLLPAPKRVRAQSVSESVAPRSHTEKTIAAIWSAVLGVELIGIHDNFFDMGGQSLLATQVMARVREAFGVQVALRTVFEQPTVAALAVCVDTTMSKGAEAGAPPLARVRREGALPLSFEQQRLWFLDQLMPGNPFYNLPVAYRIIGALDMAALEAGINHIVERHEVLRTVFTTRDDLPAQIILPHAPFALEFVRLDSAGEADGGETLNRLVQEEAQRPFDLTRGPLLRAKLIRAGEREHVLVVTMHHIVADGWSVEIFMRELAALYEAGTRGVEAQLPALPVQYADYAVWQRGWLRGEELERQLNYWKQQLEGAPTTIKLPTDRPRPHTPSFKGGFERFEVGEDVLARLKELGRRESATLFMTLLAAYATLLSRYSGERDILVGAPMANRARVEVEHLIGFFTNTLVMRVDASGDPTFRELVRRVREVSLGAYAHQDLPFEKLVEELHPQRDISRSPLFQVAFSLQDALAKSLETAGITLEPDNVDIQTAKFDLCLYLFPSERMLGGFLAYNLDLFNSETAARMVEHFVRLLGSLAAQPDARLSRLEMLLEEEKALLGRTSEVEDLTGSFSL